MSTIEETIPKRINIDGLNKIILGYLRAGGDIEAVNYKDVAERSGVSNILTSLNNKFLVDAGFLIQESPGNFKLTQNGKEYAQDIDWGRLDDARKPLQRIINDYSLFRKTIDYVKINENVSKEDLIGQIASIAGVKRTGGNKRGINTFIDLLLLSGLLTDESGTISATDATKFGKPTIEKVAAIPLSETPIPVKQETVFPINITINVSEETSVEKFTRLLEVIKDVFRESLKETQESLE
jgi:hypothetical protein